MAAHWAWASLPLPVSTTETFLGFSPAHGASRACYKLKENNRGSSVHMAVVAGGRSQVWKSKKENCVKWEKKWEREREKSKRKKSQSCAWLFSQSTRHKALGAKQEVGIFFKKKSCCAPKTNIDDVLKLLRKANKESKGCYRRRCVCRANSIKLSEPKRKQRLKIKSRKKRK